MTQAVSSTQLDYMNILVTQLKNQNPLEPMDNDQMTSQLTQFSQINLLESMNTSFSDVMKKTELTYANSLLGKEISFYGEDGNMTSGTVDKVYNNIDGQIILTIGENALELGGVVSVKDAETATEE